MMPPLFIGVALFTAMAYLDIRPGLPMIVLGQLVITIPFVLAVVIARLRQFDLDIEAAARDLGAGPLQTLRRITLPIILPALVGAALLAFAFSFDEVMITNFTSGMTATLPIFVYSRLHRSIDPSVNAVATLLLADSVACPRLGGALCRLQAGRGGARRFWRDDRMKMPANTREKVRGSISLGEPVGAIDVVGVSKRFGANIALHGIDLHIDAGSFFSLLGPSGCGKTTLLRILAGLEEPDEGQILLNGRDITHLPPEKRPFNIVFQRYALFPHLTVRDNVAFGLTTDRRERLPKEEIRVRVEGVLDLVGLRDLAGRRPDQISGGQAQRVAVARALVRRPEVLLLDEPLSALDRNVRNALREELLRIHGELGTTFLLVTHDQDEALSISERVALMNVGRIEQVAEPEAIYRNPATLFAARFIGTGSFVSGVVRRRVDDRVEVAIGDEIAIAVDAGIGEAHEAIVLFRPEELEIAPPEAGGGVAGVVEVCAFFGAHYEMTVRAGTTAFRARSPQALEPRTPVRVRWPRSSGIAYPLDRGASGLASVITAAKPQ